MKMENISIKLSFLGFIASATGLSLAASYKVIDYILAGATVAGIAAAIISAGGIAIGHALIKKVLKGAAQKVAIPTMAGW